MKFNTQHIKVHNGKFGYGLHREGKTTWETTDGKTGVSIRNVIVHKTMSAAKSLLGRITCSRRG